MKDLIAKDLMLKLFTIIIIYQLKLSLLKMKLEPIFMTKDHHQKKTPCVTHLMILIDSIYESYEKAIVAKQ